MNTISSLNAASSAKSAHAALAAQKQLAGAANTNGGNEKARQAAEDFEAVFLNTMFSQMFTGIDGEGPFGGDKSTGVWRSFLTDEYAKSVAKKGGIGIAPEIYRTLMAQQETTETAPPASEIK
jgi:Rod binding domain-containing protein